VNFALGRVKRIMQNGNILEELTLFSPALWSVFGQNIQKIQNNVKAWHRR